MRTIGEKGKSYNAVGHEHQERGPARSSGDPEMGEAEARPSVKVYLNIDSLQ